MITGNFSVILLKVSDTITPSLPTRRKYESAICLRYFVDNHFFLPFYAGSHFNYQHMQKLLIKIEVESISYITVCLLFAVRFQYLLNQ